MSFLSVRDEPVLWAWGLACRLMVAMRVIYDTMRSVSPAAKATYVSSRW